jgi:hypothetical protein
MMSTDPSPATDELAGKFTDLYSDAWGLRARIVDLRDLRIGFQISPDAYQAITELDGTQLAAMSDLIMIDPEGILLCGIRCRPDDNLPELPRWPIALVMSPILPPPSPA